MVKEKSEQYFGLWGKKSVRLRGEIGKVLSKRKDVFSIVRAAKNEIYGKGLARFVG